jgi:hypothetical protein
MKQVIAAGTFAILTVLATSAAAQENAIVHDAEYYILEAQNGQV